MMIQNRIVMFKFRTTTSNSKWIFTLKI